jgi:hypothetical protein
MEERVCINCKFWHIIPPVEDEVNECRRNAPICDGVSHNAKWYLTKGSDWCGEYQHKEQVTIGLPGVPNTSH